MLSTDLFGVVPRNLEVHEDAAINTLYHHFYYRFYDDFKPEINEKVKRSILDLSNKIKEYQQLNLGDLIKQLALGELNLNLKVFKFELDDIIGKVYQNLNVELKVRNNSRPFVYGYSSQIFFSALHCYIKFELYEDVLGFDGDVKTSNKLTSSNFKKALNFYIKSLTLDKWLKLQK